MNTAAVRRGLESGRLGALIADVLAEEPLKPDNPLWDMENVYLTPPQLLHHRPEVCAPV